METQNLISNSLDELDELESDFKSIAKELLPSLNQSHLVMLAIGVINRTLALNYGFSTLIRTNNFIAAAHLVRMNLDSYLRMHAARMVDDKELYASEILKGTRVFSLKCKSGKPLKDGYIKDNAAEYYPWMKQVYEVSSGFVHLSRKHVFTNMKVLDLEKGLFETSISKYNKYVPEESQIEAIDCMIQISKTILSMLRALNKII